MKRYTITANLLNEIVTTMDMEAAGEVLAVWAAEATGRAFGLDNRDDTKHRMADALVNDAQSQRTAAAIKSAKAKQSANARWKPPQETPPDTPAVTTSTGYVDKAMADLTKAAPFIANHAETIRRWLQIIDEKYGEQPYLVIENNIRTAVGYSGGNPDVFEAIINQSINGGWKTFYPLKPISNGNRQTGTNTGVAAVDLDAIARGMQRANDD